MSWSVLLFSILLASFISLAFYNWRLASLVLLGLLPTYVWRVSILNVPTNFLEASTIICAAMVLYKNWSDIKWPKQLNNLWVIIIWLGILVSGLIGVLLARDLRLALGIYKGWLIAPSILTWLVYYAVKKDDLAKGLINIGQWLLIGMFGSSLYAIVAGFFNNDFTRLHGSYDSPNVLAMYLVPVLAYVITLLYLYKSDIKHLYYWYAGLGLGLIALLLANSWGGLAALLVTLGLVYLYAKYPCQKCLSLTIISIILVGMIFPVYVVQHKSWPTISRINYETKVTSGQVRYILWREAAKVSQDHWLLGAGLGQWQPIFKTTIERNLPEIRNRYMAVELYYASLFPHNIWLTTWLYLGLLGIVSFIALAIYSVVAIIKQREFVLSLALILPIILHGIIDTPVFKNDNAVFWFLPLILVVFIKAKNTVKQS